MSTQRGQERSTFPKDTQGHRQDLREIKSAPGRIQTFGDHLDSHRGEYGGIDIEIPMSNVGHSDALLDTTEHHIVEASHSNRAAEDTHHSSIVHNSDHTRSRSTFPQDTRGHREDPRKIKSAPGRIQTFGDHLESQRHHIAEICHNRRATEDTHHSSIMHNSNHMCSRLTFPQETRGHRENPRKIKSAPGRIQTFGDHLKSHRGEYGDINIETPMSDVGHSDTLLETTEHHIVEAHHNRRASEDSHHSSIMHNSDHTHSRSTFPKVSRGHRQILRAIQSAPASIQIFGDFHDPHTGEYGGVDIETPMSTVNHSDRFSNTPEHHIVEVSHDRRAFEEGHYSSTMHISDLTHLRATSPQASQDDRPQLGSTSSAPEGIHYSADHVIPHEPEIIEEPDDEPSPIDIQPLSSSNTSDSTHIGPVTKEFEIVEVPDTDSSSQVTLPVSTLQIVDNSQHESREDAQNIPCINRVHICHVLALLGGFIIGYALNMTGGIFDMPIFTSRFPHIYREQNKARSTNFCSFADFLFILIISLIPLCASSTMWVALKLSNYLGRKSVLMIGLLLMLFGLGGLLWTPNTIVGIISLILVGLGVGLINQVIPTIYSELALGKVHKKLGILFGYQVLGALMVFLVNLIVALYPETWRLVFGVPSVVVIFLLVLVLSFVDETPSFLIEQDKLDAAKDILRMYRSTEDVEVEFKELVASIREGKSKSPIKELLNHQNRPTLMIKTAVQVLPQLLGVVPIMFFGPLTSTSISNFPFINEITQVAAGVLGLVSTLIITCFMQKFRRRNLALVSSFAILLSQLLMLTIFLLNPSPYKNLERVAAYTVMASLVVNYAGFTILTNPHGWVNTSILGAGREIGAVWLNSLNLLMMAIMNQASVNLLCLLGPWIFICTSIVAVAIAFFIFLFVPETTGIGEHSIVRLVWSSHWYWKKYIYVEA